MHNIACIILSSHKTDSNFAFNQSKLQKGYVVKQVAGMQADDKRVDKAVKLSSQVDSSADKDKKKSVTAKGNAMEKLSLAKKKKETALPEVNVHLKPVNAKKAKAVKENLKRKKSSHEGESAAQATEAQQNKSQQNPSQTNTQAWDEGLFSMFGKKNNANAHPFQTEYAKMDKEMYMNNQRKVVDALSDANKMAMEVAKTLSSLQNQFMKQAFEDMNTIMKSMSAAPMSPEAWKMQANAMKDSMSRAVEHSSNMSNAVIKSQSDLYNKFQNHFQDAFEEMKYNVVNRKRS